MRFAVHKRTAWLVLCLLGALAGVFGLVGLPDLAQSREHVANVIIGEVAWSGTQASGTDEWIELYNRSQNPVDVAGWELATSDLTIALTGTIAPKGFYLLERGDDDTVSDIPADLIYTGPLADTGGILILSDGAARQVDSANIDGGPWPAGTLSPWFRSMERAGPSTPDLDDNWLSNDALTRNGQDADGGPINGTPRKPNSTWINHPGEADLVLTKSGPSLATAGSEITYTLGVDNIGEVDAAEVIITDTLPAGLYYIGSDGGFPLSQTVTGTLVWQIGSVPTSTLISFNFTATIDSGLVGLVTNNVWVTTQTTETISHNNHASASTTITVANSPQLLIDSIYYDGYETNEPDEAVRLINIGGEEVNLEGWQLTDGVSWARFPAGPLLRPGETVWLTKSGSAFSRQFGFAPGYEMIDDDPDVPDLTGVWPGFSNTGDEVVLLDATSFVLDAVVYEDGDTSQTGWSGPAIDPYVISGVFAAEGQVLHRKRDQQTGLPYPDTNSAADWAQSTDDIINGRKVQYPGWDLNDFFYTLQLTETAAFTIGIAPDNAFSLLEGEISRAETSINMASYTFRNIALANALVEAIGRGVSVTILLEGGPAGGIDDQEKYACQLIETAGGGCWFMINDESLNIYDRYRHYHAKYSIFDGQRAVISTENLSPDSFPDDDKSDGTWGRRGLVLLTDAPGVVNHLQYIWEIDFDIGNHPDLFRWASGHPFYGPPPPGTVPITVTGGTTYSVRYLSPDTFMGVFQFEVVQSPENSLRDQDGLLGLLNRAGSGDTVLAQELVERQYWGATGSDPTSDPNPRLDAMLNAARRGARVRLLLDSYFDGTGSDSSNRKTCLHIKEVAADEGLDFWCALANPTGLGIHNKILLVELDDQGYLHLGSINGTEISSKGNRELAIQVKSNEAYLLLADLFNHDWPHSSLLPVVFSEYVGPADHLLISEVLYDPYGPDDSEFIEIVNPTGFQLDLTLYSLGDALDRDDFEDVRRFPQATILGSGETLVVATTATGFASRYGVAPDFEILETDQSVPNLVDDPSWGDPAATLQLGNLGDEVILRNREDLIVDAIGYGMGSVPGVVSCLLVSGPNRSLERYPFWRDTDNCLADYRDWPFPNPGDLP